MKTVIFVFLLALLSSTTVSHQTMAAPTAPGTSIEALEVELQRFAGDPLVGPEAQAVLARVPLYRHFLQQADSLSRLKRLSIIYVGQWHWVDQPSETDLRLIKASQKRVYQVLDSLDGDVIAAEGLDFGRHTPDDVRALAEAYVRTAAVPVTDYQVERLLRAWYELIGVFRFQQRYPSIDLIGVEDEPLKDLHSRYFSVETDSTKVYIEQLGQVWTDFGQALRQARTELAIAVTIVELHRSGKRFGVVILGANHELGWGDIASRYGISTKAIPSIDYAKFLREEERRTRHKKKRYEPR